MLPIHPFFLDYIISYQVPIQDGGKRGSQWAVFAVDTFLACIKVIDSVKLKILTKVAPNGAYTILDDQHENH